MSRRSASQYTGFLEWLWRVGDEDVEIIDLTDAQIINLGRDARELPPQPALPLSLIHSDTVKRSALWDLARPTTSAEREYHRSLWQRLRAENAPLRVLEEGELVSAPISYFDPVLLSCATTDWRGTLRLVGDALGNLFHEDCFNTNDIVLSARSCLGPSRCA